MPNKLLIILSALLVAVLAIVGVVLRRSRTEHPPVSATVPRVENLGTE